MSLELVQSSPEPVADFADFWLLYPRRVAKKDAQKIWARMSQAQRVAAVVACAAWRPVWAGKDLDYLPYPSTWLYGERWEDELPSTVSHASHVAAVETAAPARGEIPAHVRDLLAKLRRG
jgi:hypothetical protein